MDKSLNAVRVGFQVFIEEGAAECGAVRAVAPEGRAEIVVYIENAGDFTVAADAIRSAHDSKVVLDSTRVDKDLLAAIAHAHDREEPGL
jgi:phosphosulfolactate synthase (CoM biosynthesis protein A)